MYGGRAPKGELCNKVCMYVCKNGAWFLKGRQMQAILKHELMPVPHEFGSSLAYAVNTVMHACHGVHSAMWMLQF